jgi:glycosyl-4,4'-diaponeurosporenoate acyltransferase
VSAIVWAANPLGWPFIHLFIGYVALRLPSSLFAHDTWLTAPRRRERDGRFYRDWLAIRRWKSLLPDGAPWLGGPAKKMIYSRNSSYLVRFLVETRRAEVAHWAMLCCLPIFFLWNPPWACFVMAAYALAANLPCIAAQRYNRIAVSRAIRNVHGALTCP